MNRKPRHTTFGRDFGRILADYSFRNDPFDTDEPIVRRIKYIIAKNLSETDRRVLVYYAECGSIRDTGKRMGVSKSTIAKEIRRIRDVVIKELNQKK